MDNSTTGFENTPSIVFIFIFSIISTIGIIQRYLNIIMGGEQLSYDVRVHWMPIGNAILSGTAPYTGEAIDNKPPLNKLFITIFSIPDGVYPWFIGVAIINIGLVVLVYIISIDWFSKEFAVVTSLFFVVALPLVDGTEYQPHNVALITILASLIIRRAIISGSVLAIGMMSVQYTVLAVPLIIFKMYQAGNENLRSWLAKFICGVVLIFTLVFGSIWILFGNNSLIGSIRWTFLIGPGYILGTSSSRPSAAPGDVTRSFFHNPIFAADVLLDTTLPLLFILLPAGYGIYYSLSTAKKKELKLAVVGAIILMVPLIVRVFHHYLIFSLPFICILATYSYSVILGGVSVGEDDS